MFRQTSFREIISIEMRFFSKITTQITIHYVKKTTKKSIFFPFVFVLVHFVVRTFVKGQEDNEAVKRFITYNFERHVRRYPGQRIVILFDMSDTGLKHLVRF